MNPMMRRAQLVAQISDLQAELDEAEHILREHDEQFPPPCTGTFCIEPIYLNSMRRSDMPFVTMIGEIAERQADRSAMKWGWGTPDPLTEVEEP